MSESEPRLANSPASTESHQLPAIPQPAPGAVGVPLPAAPWIEAPDSKEGFNFTGFLHSLRRRWLSGLGIGVLLASLVAILLLLLIPETYEAFVIIRVYRDREQVLRDRAQRGVHPQEYEIEKQTQAALLKSQPVIAAALRKPGISQLTIVRDEPWFFKGTRENPQAWLPRQLKVRYQEGSEILQLSMRERKRDDLITLLNAITDAYKEEVVDKEKFNQTEKLERLQKKQRQLEDEYKAELKKMGNLAETYGSPTQSENVKLVLDMKLRKLMSLESERMGARKTLNEISDMYVQQQTRMHAGAAYQPHDFEIEDMLMQYPEYQAIAQQLLELEQAMKYRSSQLRGGAGGAGMQAQVAALEAQKEEFKYEHKDEALQRLRMLTNRDDRVMQSELRMLDSQLRLAQQRLSGLDAEYEALSEELKKMGVFSVDLEAIEFELKQKEEMSKSISQEIELLNLEMESRPQIDVLQEATIPDESNIVMKYLQIIAAWLLTLCGTVLGLTFWDMQSKRVNSSQEIIDSGDVRVIGSLPMLNGRRAGGVLPMSETGKRMIEVSLTRSIDSIRTALLFAKSKRPYEIVMITSALGQEGKTTVASQLAVSFARSGRRTLLIDADIRNPQQHVVLGMPSQQGLCELLRGEVTLDDVVQPTPAEGLWSMCAGYRDGNTDQALASPVVGKLLSELRQRFDLVVIDTGPVLTSPDAMLLGQYVDGAVISVRRDVSRLPKVTEACDRLRSVGVQIAGAVVNGAGTDIRKSELRLTDDSGVSRDPQLEEV